MDLRSFQRKFRRRSLRQPKSALSFKGTRTIKLPQLEFSDEDAAKRLKAEAAKRYQELDANLSAYDGLKTDALPLAQGMVDHSSESPKTYILVLGNYNSAVEEGGGAKVK